MDLSSYSMEDLLLAAIKSEVDANAAYSKLAGGVRNAFLKEKLRFLAGEEDKHRQALTGIFKEIFEGRDPMLPDETPVPLPDIEIPDENIDLSVVLQSAMNAEQAAYDFYTSLEDIVEDPYAKMTMTYLATMEKAHYSILELEKGMAEKFEDYDEYYPMMHAGP